MLGGILYTALGLKPVMLASILCFFVTAFLECFIKLDYQKAVSGENIGVCDKKRYFSQHPISHKRADGHIKNAVSGGHFPLLAWG